MKLVCRSFLLSLVVLFLTECKKGPEDPAISFRTRKNRLVGEWHMVSGSASYTSDGYNESFTFDGSNTKVNVTSYYPVVYTGRYLLSLNIEKDGTFWFKELFTLGNLEATGTWNFNSGVGEAKKKEEVIFFIDKVKAGYTDDQNLFNRFSTNFVYKIKELRNKKLVINSAGKIYSDDGGNYATLTTEYVFEQNRK